MARDIVKTLEVQEQMFRQMGNEAQGNILHKAIMEIRELRKMIRPISEWWEGEKLRNKGNEILLYYDGHEILTNAQLDAITEYMNEHRT